ncbi:MAG TPA: DNA topoisomerase III [Polyangiaceae bacterium]|jgi:DNA topoisomerase-3
MRLFVAEKPSLARAIAEALPGPHRRVAHHIECGGGDVVAWCAGHILQAAPPEAYGDYKAWRLDHLPITPGRWKLKVSAPELLQSIQRLLKNATRVVHAGDPDREGQLLVDEVLGFLGYKGPVERLLVRDLSPEAVRRQLASLEDNRKYRPLYESALARQRADWLYGMNMSRLYTLLGRAAGYDGVLSVGRVQTPLLGLIVARDAAIADFRAVPYFALTATIRTPRGEAFRANWSPGSSAERHLDADQRLLSREFAADVRRHVDGQSGSVTARIEDRKSEAPPLPYALATLQMDAARRLGLSAQEVLDACQKLYETHHLLTYPRSDCAYLPEGQHGQAKEVLRAVTQHAPRLVGAAAGADLTIRSKAWNDPKVTAHHAIIPTPTTSANTPALSVHERAIYELVCRRYLAQFYPPHGFVEMRIELDIAGERFVATGRTVLAPGWKALASDHEEKEHGDREGKEEIEASAGAPLPPLEAGTVVAATEVAVTEKKTQPPKAFTDATLIAAMCSVGRFVTDPTVRRILTETDGIGTPATRAAIIETLFVRGFIRRVGKTIVSSDTARALIRSLPPVATTPDMTALWDVAMRSIADRTQTLDTFLASVDVQLRALVAQGRAMGRIAVPSVPAVPSHATAALRAGPARRSRLPRRASRPL